MFSISHRAKGDGKSERPGKPRGWRGGSSRSGSDAGTSGAQRWAWDLEEGLEGAGSGRARCSPSCLAGAAKGAAQVCRAGFEAPRRGWRGACARQRSEGGGPVGRCTRAFGVSVYKSKQAEKESSKGTQTYFCPENPSLSQVPSVSARTWEWSVQVECWLDSANDVPPSQGDFTLPFGVCVCVRGG